MSVKCEAHFIEKWILLGMTAKNERAAAIGSRSFVASDLDLHACVVEAHEKNVVAVELDGHIIGERYLLARPEILAGL